MAKHGPDPSPASPLWSISLEEQFYLVWPFLAKFGGSRALATVSVVLLPVSWLVLSLHGGLSGDTHQLIWCNSFVQFQFFGLGALTAIGLHHRSPNWPNLTRLLLLLLGVASWMAASWLSHVPFAGGIPAFALISIYTLIGSGCLCLLLGLLGLPCHLVPRPAVYLGQISYGLYVFHELNLRLVSIGLNRITREVAFLDHKALYNTAELSLALLLTVLVASLSYRFYEYRFLELKERFAFVKSRP